MKRLLLFTVMTALALGVPRAGLSQSRTDEIESLRKEVEALREAVRAQQANQDSHSAILKELQEIKTLLAQRPVQAAPQQAAVVNPTLTVQSSPVRGAADAKVTIIEFSDYQCPFCGRYYRDTLPQIDAEYGKTGKVKYVFRNFPLESIHPQAFKAGEAAICAGEQGKYWEMHDRLFDNQSALGVSDFPRHAAALGLDTQRFAECVSSGRHAAAIRRDMADAQRAGVSGTPTFFIGLTQPGSSQVTAVRRLTGAQPYSSFKDAIEDALSRQK